jgi:predicted CoA-binding protein
MFENPDARAIEQLLRSARTIAIVGLSPNSARPSFGVARSLQRFGYRIVPVNPGHAEILGARAVPTLDRVGDVLAPGEGIDIVDVFRRPEHVGAIVDECIRLRMPAVWLQDGVIDEAAALRAQAAGIFTVMDRCIYRDRARLG